MKNSPFFDNTPTPNMDGLFAGGAQAEVTAISKFYIFLEELTTKIVNVFAEFSGRF